MKDADALIDDLTKYRDDLSPQLGQFASELAHLGTASGPRVHELASLRDVVEQVHTGEIEAGAAREQVDEIVSAARSGVGADTWLELIRRTEALTIQVRSRFA